MAFWRVHSRGAQLAGALGHFLVDGAWMAMGSTPHAGRCWQRGAQAGPFTEILVFFPVVVVVVII